MMPRLIILLGLVTISAVFAGCIASTPTDGNVYSRLQAEDPAVRIQAAIQAGQDSDKKAIPLLVSCLDDNEPDVRMFAGMALKRIVGDKIYDELGWKFYLSRPERNAAVQSWRQWAAKNCGNGGENDWDKLNALFKDEKGKAAGGGQNLK